MTKFPDFEFIVITIKKENLRALAVLLGAAIIFLILCQSAFSQTVRSKAEERFSAFGWIKQAEDSSDSGGIAGRSVRRMQLSEADSEENSPLSQDDEAFPAVPLAALMSDKKAPAILPDTGSLDFSSAPSQLIALFSGIASSLKSRNFSAIKAASSSAFIPILLEYMMRRLPNIEDIWFAGVIISSDATSARASFKIIFPAKSGIKEPVFALAEAIFEKGEWRTVDIIFDEDSYEQAVKQARI